MDSRSTARGVRYGARPSNTSPASRIEKPIAVALPGPCLLHLFFVVTAGTAGIAQLLRASSRVRDARALCRMH
eukprot:2546443-Rhodomonas_salina.1